MASQGAFWIRQTLGELLNEDVQAIKIYSDNQSAINMGQNQIYSPRTKFVIISFGKALTVATFNWIISTGIS